MPKKPTSNIILAVIIKFVFDLVYEGVSKADPSILYSVNWSIAYNFIDYGFLSAILLQLFFSVNNNAFLTCSLGYWVAACWELGFINSSIDEYKEALSTGGFYISQVIGLICGLIVYWFIFDFKQNKKKKWISITLIKLRKSYRKYCGLLF